MLTVFERSRDGALCCWGADGNIDFNSDNELIQYNPSNGTRQVILSKDFLVKTGPYHDLQGSPDSDIIVFTTTYGAYFSDEITFSRLLLDVAAREYLFEVTGRANPL